MNSYLAAHTFLQACGAHLQFDEFSEKAWIEAPFLRGKQQLNDRTLTELRHKMVMQTEIDPGRESLFQAALNLAYQNSYDSVRDYLESLEHDGRSYVGDWMLKRLGADLTPLNRNTLRRFLVGSVTRVLQPGARVNIMPIFVGDQRAGKTTLLRILAREPGLFTDTEVFGLDPQRRQEAVRGKLIVEVAELVGWRTARIEHAKAVISAQYDYARRAWGLCSEDQPRRFVFAGTTNERSPFRDATGNFRFPMLGVGKRIELEKIARRVDQIWAHAVVLYHSGYSLELSDKRAADLEAVQMNQLEDDSWVEALSNIEPTQVMKDELRVSYATIFAQLGIPLSQQSPPAMKRASDAMLRNGYLPPVARKVQGKAVRCFIKKIGEQGKEGNFV